MNLRNRITLKRNFSKGRLLSESDFSDLIDSTVNKIDDGFAKDSQDGLQLAPSAQSGSVLSFYKRITDPKPLWHLDLSSDNEVHHLKLQSPIEESFINFRNDGYVGVNTKSPECDMHINGELGIKQRRGTYKSGEIESNGKWQTILTESSLISTYEVVASIKGAGGTPQIAGLYALTFRVANKRRTKKLRVSKGSFFNSIRIKWKKEKNSTDPKKVEWSLQLRTLRRYQALPNGNLPSIKFHVTKLSV
jgi:hypothetical protein